MIPWTEPDLSKFDNAIKNEQVSISSTMSYPNHKKTTKSELDETTVVEYDDTLESTHLFLSDNELSKEQEELANMLNYTVFLCLYKINTQSKIPFLEFLFIKIKDAYTFPNFQYTYSSTENDFYDKCSLFYESIFNSSFSQQEYKGFTTYKDHSVFVFLNIEDVKIPVLPVNTIIDMRWAIIDEINVRKRILTTNIDSSILLFFEENHFASLLKDGYGSPIILPYMLYLCNIKETEKETDTVSYENIFYETMYQDTTSYYYPMLEYQDYGMNYLFTTEPLSVDVNDLVKIKRFAVFVENFEYLHKIDSLPTEFHTTNPAKNELWMLKTNTFLSY